MNFHYFVKKISSRKKKIEKNVFLQQKEIITLKKPNFLKKKNILKKNHFLD
jgi:hypothetical protein